MAKRGYVLETGKKAVDKFAKTGLWGTGQQFAKNLGYEMSELENLYWTTGVRDMVYSPKRKVCVTVGIVVHDRLFPELVFVDEGKDGKLYIEVEEFDKLC